MRKPTGKNKKKSKNCKPHMENQLLFEFIKLQIWKPEDSR